MPEGCQESARASWVQHPPLGWCMPLVPWPGTSHRHVYGYVILQHPSGYELMLEAPVIGGDHPFIEKFSEVSPFKKFITQTPHMRGPTLVRKSMRQLPTPAVGGFLLTDFGMDQLNCQVDEVVAPRPPGVHTSPWRHGWCRGAGWTAGISWDAEKTRKTCEMRRVTEI